MEVVFSGDIAIRNKIEAVNLDDNFLKILHESDFQIANFEAPVINNSCLAFKKAGPHIFQEQGYEKILPYYSHFSLANNHIMDYGKDGLLTTCTILKNATTYFAGAGLDFTDIYKPIILKKNDVSVAVLCLGESEFGSVKNNYDDYLDGGYAWTFNSQVYSLIQKLKNENDFVVLYNHGGLENFEYPLPEWRDAYKQFIDYGADVIIGTHPHIIQGKEKYRTKWIYYSLGNFIMNNGNSSKDWISSLHLKLHISKQEIKIEEFFTEFEESGETLDIRIIENPEFHKLSNLLLDEKEYLDLINDKCIEAYHDYYETYYTQSIVFDMGHNYSVRRALKNMIKRLVFRNKKAIIAGTNLVNGKIKNKVLMMHNIKIETHRWCVLRALALISKTY